MYKIFSKKFHEFKLIDTSDKEKFLVDLSELAKYFQDKLISADEDDFDVINHDFCPDEEDLFERKTESSKDLGLVGKHTTGLLNELAEKFFSNLQRLGEIKDVIRRLNIIRWRLVDSSLSDESLVKDKSSILLEIENIRDMLKSG